MVPSVYTPYTTVLSQSLRHASTIHRDPSRWANKIGGEKGYFGLLATSAFHETTWSDSVRKWFPLFSSYSNPWAHGADVCRFLKWIYDFIKVHYSTRCRRYVKFAGAATTSLVAGMSLFVKRLFCPTLTFETNLVAERQLQNNDCIPLFLTPGISYHDIACICSLSGKQVHIGIFVDGA